MLNFNVGFGEFFVKWNVLKWLYRRWNRSFHTSVYFARRNIFHQAPLQGHFNSFHPQRYRKEKFGREREKKDDIYKHQQIGLKSCHLIFISFDQGHMLTFLWLWKCDPDQKQSSKHTGKIKNRKVQLKSIHTRLTYIKDQQF